MSESKPASIRQQMGKVQDRVGMTAYGLDYLLDNDAPAPILNRYMAQQQERLAQTVAGMTGGRVEDITDSKKRTAEQERLLAELAGKETLYRWAKFRNSDYTQVLEGLLSHYKGTGDRPADLDTISDKDQIAIHDIALYFYATHPEHDPMESGSISDADRAQIFAYLDTAMKIQRDNPRKTFTQAVSKSLGIPTGTRRTKTKSEGITEVYERALSITNKDYQWALTPYKNDTAYIARIDPETWKNIVFNKDGALSPLESRASEADVKRAAEKSGIPNEIDIQLLRSVFTALFHNIKRIEGSKIRVHLPPFCKAMGIDISKGNSNDLFSKFAEYREWVGFTKKGIHSLLTFSEYDAETNDMVFDTPYMFAIIKQIDEISTVRLPSGKIYQNPAYSFLIHSDIVKERNKPAIEIVQTIIALLHQRGNVTAPQIKQANAKKKETRKKAAAPISAEPADKTVNAHKKYSAIVAEIPMLNDRIANSNANAANTQLKRAFGKAFELLRTKTDAYEYFTGLNIPNAIPTITTLDTALIITHKGINPNYKAKK